MGKSVREALMAAWTSLAAPSTVRFRSNCSVIEVPPSVLTDVISVTPAMAPRRFSSGAARDEATVAGSAPGRDAEITIIGKSTRGIGATGILRYAAIPTTNNPIASNDVPTGRRINGWEIFTAQPAG